MENNTMNDASEAFLDHVRETLFLAGHSQPASINKDHVVLQKLEDVLFMLRAKGFKFTEISTLLQYCGISMLPEVIHDYFHQLQDKSRQHARYVLSERATHIEHGLRHSLINGNGLFLHYQPQVNMHTGEVIGAEALLRWEFNGELVPPSEFIPVAERSDLIVELGNWALREACREAKRWQSIGLRAGEGIKVGVNLSVKQLAETLPEQVQGIISDIGLPPNLLGLEITESFLVNNDSLSMLHTLRENGIHLSMDDFGIGYSCLAQLKNIPINTIKIDRVFVEDLGQDGNHAVVETIIDLARKLGVKTLAEGVENKSQAEALMEMGCSVCQGYLYSKPLPGDVFVKYAQQ